MYLLSTVMPDGDSYVFEVPLCVSTNRETLVALAKYELVDVVPEMEDYNDWTRSHIREIDVV